MRGRIELQRVHSWIQRKGETLAGRERERGRERQKNEINGFPFHEITADKLEIKAAAVITYSIKFLIRPIYDSSSLLC